MEHVQVAKDRRLALPALGEYYNDILSLDAWVNNRTRVTQAQNLLCAKLQEREIRIKERLEYIAKKRGITVDELWTSILNGTAEQLETDEDN
jgi:hypothetical protein